MKFNKIHKIGVIGCGQIGGTIAFSLIMQNLGTHVVMLDKNDSMAKGKALDISQAAAIMGKEAHIIGTADYAELAGADAIIITAGIPRKPGMTREELLSINLEIISGVAEGVKKHAKDAFVVVITNPLDVMVQAFYKYSGLPANKIVGMAGVLDAGRYRRFLSQELSVSEQDVKTMVVGAHGDTMLLLADYSSAAGIPISKFIEIGKLSETKLEASMERARKGGAEIVGLLQNGSAFYAPAVSAIEMIEAYLYDRKRLMSCAAHLKGEYGVKDCYIGVPVIIGKSGVEEIIELPLTPSQTKLFDASVATVRDLMAVAKI